MNRISKQYATYLFDCDGVILNSNRVKSQLFYETALPFGEAVAESFYDYHIAHGGISRYVKFDYLTSLLVRQGIKVDKAVLLKKYRKLVFKALLDCEIFDGLQELKRNTQEANWAVVSGSDETELRQIFAKRKIAEFFNNGVYGSPKSKDCIFKTLLETGLIKLPAIYFGDSKYDYIAAKNANIQFVFLHKWTEMSEWEDFVTANQIPHFADLKDVNDRLASGITLF